MSAQQVDPSVDSAVRIVPLFPLPAALGPPLIALVEAALEEMLPDGPMGLNLPLARYEVVEGTPHLLTLRLLCSHEHAHAANRFAAEWMNLPGGGLFLSFAFEAAPEQKYYFLQDCIAVESAEEVAMIRRQIDSFTEIPEDREIASPLFMPRNEEEQMRNLLALSGQIRFVRDLPQAIIQYDSQRRTELAFTVLLVRLLRTSGPSLREMVAILPLRHIVEEVRKLGTLKGKYPKEAATVRVYVEKEPYLRADGRIDLPRARHAVVEALQSILGKFRDFNGGLLEKQQEAIAALKRLLRPATPQQVLEVENFFYSIRPGLMRTVLTPEVLAALYRFGETAPCPSYQWEDEALFAHLPPQQTLPPEATTAQRGKKVLLYLRPPSMDSEGARHVIELAAHLAPSLVHEL